MGSGVNYRCSKCKKEYGARTGIGYLFPVFYEKTLEAVKNGEYGEERKKIAVNEQVAVDAEKYVYVCKSCGHWKVEPGLNLYTPKQPAVMDNKYFLADEIERDFRIRKKYIHTCEKCGGTMHKATREEEDNLKCPYCGGERDQNYKNFVCWD